MFLNTGFVFIISGDSVMPGVEAAWLQAGLHKKYRKNCYWGALTLTLVYWIVTCQINKHFSQLFEYQLSQVCGMRTDIRHQGGTQTSVNRRHDMMGAEMITKTSYTEVTELEKQRKTEKS